MKRSSFIISIIFHLLLIVIALRIVVNHSNRSFNTVTVVFGSFSNKAKKSKKLHKLDFEKEQNFPFANNEGEGDFASNNNMKSDSLTSELLPEDSTLIKYGNGKFEIDFQGNRKRTIYNYVIPTYPSGVDKEVDLVFQVTIAPDGTVQRIFPLTKGDTRLEVASVNALNKWRFEPLPKDLPQVNQVVIVVFPYRLK